MSSQGLVRIVPSTGRSGEGVGRRLRDGPLPKLGGMLPIQVQTLLSGGRGLASFAELRSVGVEAAQLAQLLASGDLVRVRRGIYTDGDLWRSAPPGAARELLRARAVRRVLPHPHLLSHDSAAYVLGLAFLAPRDPWVHITRARIHGDRPLAGVKQHRGPYRPEDVEVGLEGEVLGPARTALDLVRQYGIRCGIGACDSARRAGVSTAELWDAAAEMGYWRGVKTVRNAIRWNDPGADNPGESLARLLVIAAAIGDPVTQFPVALGTSTAWADLRVGRLLVEFDGRVKYQTRAVGGFGGDDPGQVVWHERQRERALLTAGFGVFRMVWADLQPERWAGTVTRLRDEFTITTQRLGGRPSAQHQEFAERCAEERRRRIFSSPSGVA